MIARGALISFKAEPRLVTRAFLTLGASQALTIPANSNRLRLDFELSQGFACIERWDSGSQLNIPSQSTFLRE